MFRSEESFSILKNACVGVLSIIVCLDINFHVFYSQSVHLVAI